jgi:hypothetical protein
MIGQVMPCSQVPIWTVNALHKSSSGLSTLGQRLNIKSCSRNIFLSLRLPFRALSTVQYSYVIYEWRVNL